MEGRILAADQCSEIIMASWGQSDRSKAMSQCSGAVATPWGKVDIARTSGYGSVQWSRYDSMG